MNRRNFLKTLGLVAAAPIAAKLIPKAIEASEPAGYTTYLVGADALISPTIGSYADYISISDLAFEASISPVVVALQKEISYRLASTLDTFRFATV